MSATAVPYNATTPEGRAITHLLEKSALARVIEGIEVKELSGGGRTLVVHPQFAAVASNGELSLLLAVESIAGLSNVNLSWLLADIDEGSKRAVAEAVLIAGGFRGLTYVEVA